MAVVEHNRTSYKQGCRCGVCTASNSAYLAAYRRRRRAGGIAVAPPLPDGVESRGAVGPAVAAVQLEVDLLGVAATRPGLVAATLSMAAILDNAEAISSHAAACGQLLKSLAELHRCVRPGGGRLSSVKSLSAPSS
jgi:hypothetical protein